MPLPIPTILENASNVITEARNSIESGKTNDLESALCRVNESDLLAVMNEIGNVYSNVKNLRVTAVGSRANTTTKQFEVVIQLNAMPVPLLVVMTYDQAQQLLKQFQADLQVLRPGGLITEM